MWEKITRRGFSEQSTRVRDESILKYSPQPFFVALFNLCSFDAVMRDRGWAPLEVLNGTPEHKVDKPGSVA